MVPYSVLVERPGIKLIFTQTGTGEDVSIINENSPDRNITIGQIPQVANKNYIRLNQETRYVPQIKKLYTMFLKKESEKLLLSKEERQKALGDLLRCDEVHQLYMKAGRMTTMYYEITEVLFRKNVPVLTDLVRKVIENNISRGEHDKIPQLVQAYQNQHDTFTLMEGCIEKIQEVNSSHKTPCEQILGHASSQSSAMLNGFLRAEASEFKPQLTKDSEEPQPVPNQQPPPYFHTGYDDSHNMPPPPPYTLGSDALHNPPPYSSFPADM